MHGFAVNAGPFPYSSALARKRSTSERYGQLCRIRHSDWFPDIPGNSLHDYTGIRHAAPPKGVGSPADGSLTLMGPALAFEKPPKATQVRGAVRASLAKTSGFGTLEK